MTSEMNKDQDYASDTDESDEDFRPNEAGESAVSEEESDGCVNEEEQAGEEEEITKQKKNVRKSKKLTKKSVKKKTTKNKDDDSEEDEDEVADDKISGTRRSTRQTEDSQTNGRGKNLEKDELESEDEDKSRTNALWADFLKDVGPSTKPNKAVTVEKPSSSSSNGKAPSDAAPTPKVEKKLPQESSTKITVTEVLDFAGEEIRIQKEVDASSIKENKAAATTAPKMQPSGRILPGAGIKRPAVGVAGSSSGGLGSILNKIGKKQKISVLDKSQMDWKSFKQEEGIDETLQTYNKGKDG